MPIPYDDAGDNIVNEPEIMPESNQVRQDILPVLGDFVGGASETPCDSNAEVEWVEEP